MIIHLSSDIHSEMGQWIAPAVSSDVVVCAGDIGTLHNIERLKKYFSEVKETTDNIIWVLGNHEFYHSNYEKCLDYANDFATKHNIHLLDEALGTADLELDGVTFWGSTLWTDTNNGDYFAKQVVGNGLNDYHVVETTKNNITRKFSIDDTIEINKRTRSQINWNADVVITHHCPILIKHSKYPLNDVTYGFCNTGLEQQIMDSDIKYWLSGHTHDSVLKELNKTLVLSNQHGYSRYDYNTGGTILTEDCGFDPKLTIEV